MKVVPRSSWVVKLSGAILASVLALPVYAQLMLAHEGHHDAGGCTISNAEFLGMGEGPVLINEVDKGKGCSTNGHDLPDLNNDPVMLNVE